MNTNEKLSANWQFSETYGLTSYGRGWIREVVNRWLENYASTCVQHLPERFLFCFCFFSLTHGRWNWPLLGWKKSPTGNDSELPEETGGIKNSGVFRLRMPIQSLANHVCHSEFCDTLIVMHVHTVALISCLVDSAVRIPFPTMQALRIPFPTMQSLRIPGTLKCLGENLQRSVFEGVKHT